MTQIIEDTCFEVADGIGPPERLLMDENAAPYLVGVRKCDLVVVVAWYAWWERRKCTHGTAGKRRLDRRGLSVCWE